MYAARSTVYTCSMYNIWIILKITSFFSEKVGSGGERKNRELKKLFIDCI